MAGSVAFLAGVAIVLLQITHRRVVTPVGITGKGCGASLLKIKWGYPTFCLCLRKECRMAHRINPREAAPDSLILRKFVQPEFIFGLAARKLVGLYAKNFAARRVLVVTDPGVIAAGWTRDVTESLEAAGLT